MKTTPALFSLIGLLLTTSCAFQARSLSTNSKPDRQAVIFYGCLNVNHDFAYENQLALWLQNLDTKKSVYIFFDMDQSLKVIEAGPGRYQMAGFVGVNRSHKVKVRHAPPAGKVPPIFTAAAGSEIYLGDFSGTVTYDGYLARWGIKSITNNFDATTLEFRRQYPHLGTVPATSVFDLLKQQN